jgi:hypothetical protein
MSESRMPGEPTVEPHEAGAPADVAPPIGEPSDEPAPDGAARPSVAPRVMGWRDETVGTALITAAIGVWLLFSPEALGYGTGDATINPVICGILIAVFSVGRLISSWRSFPLGVILFVLGVWLVVSAFLFEAPPGGQANQAGFGGIVALLSLIGLAGSQRGRELNPPG